MKEFKIDLNKVTGITITQALTYEIIRRMLQFGIVAKVIGNTLHMLLPNNDDELLFLLGLAVSGILVNHTITNHIPTPAHSLFNISKN